MKTTILCALLLLLPTSLIAADQITIDVRFIEYSGKGAMPHNMVKLADTEGVDCIALQSVTTKAGQEARLELPAEMQQASVLPSLFPPGFSRVPIGLFARVTPNQKGDIIAYTAHFATCGAPIIHKAPVGQTCIEIPTRDFYVSGSSRYGEEVWLDFSQPGKKKKFFVWLRFKLENTSP